MLSQSLVWWWVSGRMPFWPHDIFAAFLLHFCCIFAAFLKEPLSGALSSCMTFLDLTEGDKLAFVVVELHVGPRRQCDALGNSDQVFVVFSCIFE